MSEYASRIVVGAVVAALVGISIIIGVVYLPSGNMSKSISSTSLSTASNMAETTNITLGIELSLSIENRSPILPGDTISFNLTVYNILTNPNDLSVARNWPASTFIVDPCNPDFPLSMGVVGGYYNLSNLTSVNKSQIVDYIEPNTAYHCPLVAKASNYNFEPDSDLVNNCFNANNTICTYPISRLVTVNGTWTDNSTSLGSAMYHELTPGFYTVIAGDEWGQVALIHFQVKEP